jgi:signal transduction histidine kinase
LHDGPAQEISLALLRLDHVAARCAADGSDPAARTETEQEIDLIQLSLRRALQEVRAASSGLLLPELEKLTLGETVVHVTRGHRRRTGALATVSLRAVPEQAPLATKIALYRIIQEALTNSWRHAAGADQSVGVEGRDGFLRVEVTDTGPGFDPATVGASEQHLGLVGMRERVESLGGEFRIESAPGQGTRVVATLPMPPDGGADE